MSGLGHSLISRPASDQRTPTRGSIAKRCAGLGLARADADRHWLSAEFLPPDLSGGICARR